jgi:hypothetical protein
MIHSLTKLSLQTLSLQMKYMQQYNTHTAKTHLSALVEKVAKGRLLLSQKLVNQW